VGQPVPTAALRAAWRAAARGRGASAFFPPCAHACPSTRKGGLHHHSHQSAPAFPRASHLNRRAPIGLIRQARIRFEVKRGAVPWIARPQQMRVFVRDIADLGARKMPLNSYPAGAERGPDEAVIDAEVLAKPELLGNARQGRPEQLAEQFVATKRRVAAGRKAQLAGRCVFQGTGRTADRQGSHAAPPGAAARPDAHPAADDQ